MKIFAGMLFSFFLCVNAQTQRPLEAERRPDTTAVSLSPEAPKRPDTTVVAASLEALAAQAVSKLNSKDTVGLYRLSFRKKEFLAVYPLFEKDTSSDRREFACNYYLADNQKILMRILEREGGRDYAMSRLAVDGPVEQYGSMTLYRGMRIWVRRNGVESELRLMKSAAKIESGWKIWSFPDD